MILIIYIISTIILSSILNLSMIRNCSSFSPKSSKISL